MSTGKINFQVGFNVDQTGLNQLKASLANIQNTTTKDLINTQSITNADKELRKIHLTAEKVGDALQDAMNPALNTVNIEAFRQNLSKSGLTIQKIKTDFQQLGLQGTAAFRQLTTAITSTKLPLQESHNLLKSMGTTLANTLKWSIASSAINTVVSSIQEAWSYTKELDKSLNNIMIVTDKSSASMEQFARQANKAAKALGASTTDYTNAALIYYQQGLNDAEVKARTETTLKAANITKQSADTVSEQLTSVWNGYKVSAQETELYIDKLSAVAATTASDLEELSTGMSKVASAASNMGVDIDQLNGMLATAISVTRQAPETIGTAFKTIFARISDIEAGLDTEATLGEYTKRMAEVGFSVLDANGKLRDMGDVIEEIGGKWETLTKEQQVSLAQTMAGTRQYNNLLALFENWDMYQQAVQTSVDSTGTLQAQQDKYMESTEARLEKLETAGQRVYQALFDKNTVDSFADTLTVIVDKFGSFVESIGGGKTLLMALIPIATKLFAGTLASGMATFITNMNNAKNTTASLSSLLDTIKEIKMDSSQVGELDQKLLSLRENLIQLHQANVITNEEFNQITDSINAYADAITRAEEAQQKYSSGGLQSQLNDFLDTAGVSKDKMADQDLANLANYGQNKFMDSGISRTDTLAQLEDKSFQDQGIQESWNRIQDSINNVVSPLKDAATETRAFANEVRTLAEGDAVSLDKQIEDISIKAKDLRSNGFIGENAQKKLEQAVQTLESFKGNTNLTEKELYDLRQAANNAARIMQQGFQQASAKAQELSANVKGGVTGEFIKAGQSAEQFGAQAVMAMEKANLEKKITQFTSLASSVGMCVSGITMLSNIGAIWDNEDLTSGEKFLQTVQNLAFAIPMILPVIRGLTGSVWGTVKAFKAEKEAIRQTNIEKAKKQSLDVFGTTIEKLAAAASNESLAPMIRQLHTTELLKLAKEELGDEYLESIGVIEAETKALDKNTASRIANDIAQKKGGGDVDLDFKNSQTGKGLGNSFKSGAKKLGTGLQGFFTSWAGAAVAAIAIIAAATAGVMWLANAEERKHEENIKKAKEQQQALNQELEATKSRYNDLKASIENLGAQSDNLDKLVEGSLEWKEALAEANNEVLNLLNTYPELYQYLSKDERGKLSISQEGLDLVQEKEFEKVQSARAAKLAADMSLRQAEIDKETHEAATIMAKNQHQASIAGGTTAGAGVVGAAAGGIGASIATAAGVGSVGGPVGMIIGAAVGVLVGAIGAGINYAVEEAEEDKFEEAIANGGLDRVVKAYMENGESALASEASLEKLIGPLTGVEKALLANKDAALELVEALAAQKATEEMNYIEIGRALLGEDATSGAALAAGKAYQEQYEIELQALRDNAGFNGQDEEEAKKALKLMGLSESNFLGTEGADQIQYTDEQGNEKKMSMEQVYAILAKDAAEKKVQASNTKIDETVEKALNAFSDSQKELISLINSEQFTLKTASLADLQAISARGLTDAEYSQLASSYGMTVEEVKSKLNQAISDAFDSWENPKNLKLDARKLFKEMFQGTDFSELTAQEYTTFTNTFQKMYDQFGAEGVGVIDKLLEAAGSNADNVIKKLNSFDWSSQTAVYDFYKLLDEFDVAFDSTYVEQYIDQMRTLNNIIIDESLDAIYSFSASLSDLTKDLIKNNTLIYEGKKDADADDKGDPIVQFRALLGEDFDKFFLKIEEYIDSNREVIEKYAVIGSPVEIERRRIAKRESDADEEVKKAKTAYDTAQGEANKVNADKKAAQAKYEEQKYYYNNLGGVEAFAFGESPVDPGSSRKRRLSSDIKNTIAYTQDENGQYIYDPQSLIDLFNKEIITTIEESHPETGEMIEKQVSSGKAYASQFQGLSSIFEYLLSGNADELIDENERQYYEAAQEVLEAVANGTADKLSQDTLQLASEIFNNDTWMSKLSWDVAEAYGKEYGELGAAPNVILQNADTEKAAFKATLKDAILNSSSFEEQNGYLQMAKEYGFNFADGEFLDQAQLNVVTKYANNLDSSLGLSSQAFINYVKNTRQGSETLEESFDRAFKTLITDSRLSLEAIEDLNNEIDKLSDSFDTLNDASKLENLNQQIELQGQLISELRSGTKLKLKAGTLQEELGNIDAKLASQIFNEDGSINQAAYEAFLNLEKDDLQSEGLDEAWQQALNSIETYEKAYEDGQKQLRDAIKKQYELELQKFEFELELKLDKESIKRQYNDLMRELTIDEKESSKLIESYLVDYDSLLVDFENIQSSLESINQSEMSAADKAEQREKLTADLGNTLKEIKSTIDSINEAWGQSLDNIQESYDKAVSYLETINSLFEKQKKLQELIYGEQSAKDMRNYYAQIRYNAEQQEILAKQNYEDALARYQESIAEDTKHLYTDEQRERLVEDMTKTLDAYSEAIVNSATAIQEEYFNNTKSLIEDFNKEIMGMSDISSIKEDWEWQKKINGNYYDTINASYELQKLGLKFANAANETTNIKLQQKINALRKEELNALQEKEKLSEYDIERAEKRLEILQTEIALQDAQDAKTQMRLMRQQDGTYSYQYVADQEKINEQREKLIELNQELYNLDVEQYEEALEQFYDAYEDFTKGLQELVESGATEEELAEYVQKHKTYLEQLAFGATEVRINLQEAIASSNEQLGLSVEDLIVGTSNVLNTTIAKVVDDIAIKGLDNTFKILLNQLNINAEAYYENIRGKESALSNLMTDEENGSIALYQKLYAEQKIVYDQYGKEYTYIKDVLGPQVDTLASQYNGLAKEIDNAYSALIRYKKEDGQPIVTSINDRLGGGGTTDFIGPPAPEEDPKTTDPLLDEDKKVIAPTVEENPIPQLINSYYPSFAKGVDDNAAVRLRGNKGLLNSKGNPTHQGDPDAKLFLHLNGKVYEKNGTKYVTVHPQGESGWYWYAPVDELVTWQSHIEAVGINEYQANYKKVFKSYDTGGYTGDWNSSEGRMAMLHEKEIVLNKHDTSNFLEAVDILRGLNLSMLSTISGLNVSSRSSAIAHQVAGAPLEQVVQISAEFPNVNSKEEIEAAFSDLINLAAQHAFKNTRG